MAGNKFMKVECPGCGNRQIIFSKPSMIVTCQACNETLAKPTGGKAEVIGKVLQILG